MKSSLAPTRRAHRGHVRALGLFFATDDANARRAILRALRPGSTVGAASGGLVHFHAVTVRSAADGLEGAAIADEGGVRSTAPLSEAERRAAREARAVLVVARAGSLVHVERVEPLDPSSWLDLAGLTLVEPASLGRPPRAVESVERARPAREALGLPAASAESEALRRAILARAGGGTALAGAAETRGAPSAIGRALAAGLRGLASLARSVASFVRGLGASGSAPRLPSSASREGSTGSELAPPRPPGWLARLDAWLRDRMRDLGWRSLGRWLAQKHAEHLQKLLSLLDDGDVDEALRHAIPLTDTPGASGVPSLALPVPRSELAISPRRAGHGGALGLPPSLFQHLRARYRALYDRLVTLGRWRDAAFVLAELLDDALGAVALLEKYGFLREAAELAEGRELPPAVVVRQWLVARDLERAIDLARRHDAFAPALARLQRSEPEAASALALAWADLRARSGDFLGALAALEAGNAVDRARGLALRWAERAAEAGGALEGEALVWQLVLDGGALARIGPRLEEILRAASVDERHRRQAIYLALSRRKPSSLLALAAAARLAWRAALRDRALFGEPMVSTLGDLETLARDGTLAADRPTITPLGRTRLAELTAPRLVAPTASGAFGVLDAVVLPDRRVLVALGEAGLRVLAPDGRTVVAFDVPAEEIVLSDEGTRALAVARRGTLAVVHRVDTIARRVGDRFDLVGLGSVAPSFDGERWAVVLEDTGVILDVAREQPRALFRLQGERTIAVDRSVGFVSFVVGHPPSTIAPSGLERLRYEERTAILRERRALPERFGMDGRLLGLERLEPTPVHLMMTHGRYHVTDGLTAYPGSREQPGRPRGHGALAASEHFLSVVVEHAGRGEGGAPVVDVVVLDRDAKRERLIATIDPGTGPPIERVGARHQTRRGEPTMLVVCDSTGRVLAVDVEDGRVVVDVGVR